MARKQRYWYDNDPTKRPSGDRHYLRQHPEKVRRGALNNHAKLTETEVREIWRLFHREGWPQTHIARAFDVSQGQIWAIVHRKQWLHVTAALVESSAADTSSE